ncbi:MAG: int [Polyangiaceae bacterium]|nr:int [Polyangiaceae bacterium]
MKASILKHHLLPVFGEMRLDAIKMHAIEILKADLLAKGLSRKRVNNILACLGKMLRYAHEIELLEVVPRVKLLKVLQQRFDFLNFEELSRLVEAMKDDPERLALVLLGAEAGLRQGETIALEWGDVDLVAGLLTVRRSSWKGLSGDPQERQRTEGAANRPLEGSPQGHQAPEVRARALPSGRLAADSVGDRGGAPVRLQTRRAPEHRLARAAAHLLLPPRDARRGTEGDSGAGRAQHAHDDAQVQAPGAERALRSHGPAQLGRPVGGALSRSAWTNENVYETVAEREGFEPSVRLPVHMISSHAPSASRSPLLRPDDLALKGGVAAMSHLAAGA